MKLKTNRSVKKRFKITKKGKLKRRRAYKGHLLTMKSSKRKRHLRRSGLVFKTEAANIRKLLPYG